MAILETLTIEPDEAALGRFFYEEAQVDAWTDLADAQTTVNDLTEVIRMNGIEGGENVALLEKTLTELTEAVKGHKGWLVMALSMPARFTRDRMKPLLADYTVQNPAENQAVVFIPTDAITAFRLNPQIYGSGEAIEPVINMRIKTSEDKPQTMYGGVALENLGRWFQVPLESTPLALLSELEPLEPEPNL